jgi:hypothetical protein
MIQILSFFDRNLGENDKNLTELDSIFIYLFVTSRGFIKKSLRNIGL